ncbi:MAG TPA: GNAT family N-acetyltransferase [Alphaproteobacteria bacterium]|nr:GNAT family N-acetyltransferase [Alphaproteobacteria bacterium]
MTDRMSARSFRHLVTRAQADCLLAAVGGKPVGYAALFYRRRARVARLHSLAVDPAAHRSGIGRALLEASEAAARSQGASVLRLAVRQDNERATRLYRSSGYREIGVEPDYYADGMAAFTMEKNIASG